MNPGIQLLAWLIWQVAFEYISSVLQSWVKSITAISELGQQKLWVGSAVIMEPGG